jgi:hypothetical protein
MSRFECSCGHVVSDTTDNLPYKAHVVPDESMRHVVESSLHAARALMDRVAQLVEARERGEQAQYVARTRRPHVSPDTPLRELLDQLFGYQAFELLNYPIFMFGRLVYECEACGRLWLTAEPDRKGL